MSIRVPSFSVQITVHLAYHVTDGKWQKCRRNRLSHNPAGYLMVGKAIFEAMTVNYVFSNSHNKRFVSECGVSKTETFSLFKTHSSKA